MNIRSFDENLKNGHVEAEVMLVGFALNSPANKFYLPVIQMQLQVQAEVWFDL